MANLNFNVYNRLGVEVMPMSGYSLPFEQFQFIADFDSVPTLYQIDRLYGTLEMVQHQQI